MWRNRDTGLATYSLALLNNVAYNVIEFAKSQVTWTKGNFFVLSSSGFLDGVDE